MAKQEGVSDEYYRRGLSLAKIEDYKEASKYFDKAIESDPNNLLAWISKANALIELGNEEEAKVCVEKVREIDPSYPSLSNY